MTEAYKCDKCGEYKTGKPKTNWKYSRNYNSDTRLNMQITFDLCSDCSDELLGLIEE